MQDHTKTVIKRTPFNVEVCSEVNVQGDKQKIPLGAIIGGAIGQNITKDLPDGALLVNHWWYSWKSKLYCWW